MALDPSFVGLHISTWIIFFKIIPPPPPTFDFWLAVVAHAFNRKFKEYQQKIYDRCTRKNTSFCCQNYALGSYMIAEKVIYRSGDKEDL